MPINTVAIVGVGLIGGSFGLALKASGFTGTGFHGQIIGVSSARSIETACACGAIDRGASLEEAAAVADLIYLAQPVGGILSALHALDPLVRPAALVTDAGSTKQTIVDTARTHLKRCAFLGGHPLAGKESRGVENADPELFRNRPYLLTPSGPEDLESEMAHDFRRWLRNIGVQEVIIGAQEHDRVMAFSSHLPQLASTALASLLSGEEVLAGPGLIGATRLALSSFDVWRDILATNSEQITEALTAYIQQLEHLRENLRTREAQQEFTRAAALARRVREQSY